MFRKQILALFLVINILGLFNSGYSQSEEKKYNQQYNPVTLVKRLSYENFKNIKMLRNAIMNYGGGEAEVQKLVDQYAEATALYFEEKIEESASKFSENEREIFKVAKRLATEYDKECQIFLNNAIKKNITIALKQEVEGKHRDVVMDKYLDNAKAAQKRASSILNDYKYTSDKNSTSAQRLVSSIFYYRLVKKNLFMMYVAYVDPMKLDTDGKKDKEKKEQLVEKMIREDYKGDYKKDLQDNENKLFKSMEKKI